MLNININTLLRQTRVFKVLCILWSDEALNVNSFTYSVFLEIQKDRELSYITLRSL